MSYEQFIRDLPRAFCEAFLTEQGFQVYDKEGAGTLREAIIVNINDGTFLYVDVEMAHEAWERNR